MRLKDICPLQERKQGAVEMFACFWCTSNEKE